jgi:L-2-hydroxyglutarate oxidase
VDDWCVIGGGIVGLATAREILRRRPGSTVRVLEKEPTLASHQTGHNSGVIHSGIYYAPGSLKAQLCVAGAAATKAFAAEHGIDVLECGKLLVAVRPVEIERMEALAERAHINGITVERLDRAALSDLEPAVRGLAALRVPSTAVVDYRAICAAMAAEIDAAGGQVETGVRVTGIRERGDRVEIEVGAHERSVAASRLVACAGVQADRIAAMAGLRPDFRIVPFRGEYYRLPYSRADLVSHLIYPVPDPALPFLGIHVTRTISGGVTVGPNAVLGRAREGYRKSAVNGRDVLDYLRFPGMWRMARHNMGTGVKEMRDSLSKRAYLARVREYCPELTVQDLLPEPAGIRAQAVMRDGALVHDFLFAESDRTLHVCNAPSPAATSAMPIAGHIADRLGL